jgi:hypothetical protein
MECTVRVASTPTWEAIRDQLTRIGEPVQLRMIDGLPAFPDETPTDDWKELRLGFRAGMVTIRRGTGSLSCAIWGNADENLEMAWRKVIWASAAAGDGEVETASGSVSADAFACSIGIQTE